MSEEERQYSKIALKRFFRAIEEIRDIYSDMQIQTALVFLTTALNPGITMREIQNRTGLVQASVSRNISLLSEWQKHDQPGLNLVETTEDPHERRRKIVYLTPKGEELACSIADLMR